MDLITTHQNQVRSHLVTGNPIEKHILTCEYIYAVVTGQLTPYITPYYPGAPILIHVVGSSMPVNDTMSVIYQYFML